MFIFESEEKEIERIIVSCDENGCDGTFTVNRWSIDFSPRVHDNCSKCNRFVSVKLSSWDNPRILSREWI